MIWQLLSREKKSTILIFWWIYNTNVSNFHSNLKLLMSQWMFINVNVVKQVSVKKKPDDFFFVSFVLFFLVIVPKMRTNPLIVEFIYQQTTIFSTYQNVFFPKLILKIIDETKIKMLKYRYYSLKPLHQTISSKWRKFTIYIIWHSQGDWILVNMQ